MRYVALILFYSIMNAVDIELETITPDTTLKEMIVRHLRNGEVIVKDSVLGTKGVVIYWGTPTEYGSNYDDINIYDYKESLFKNDGAVTYHNQVPLRLLYNLKWERNGAIDKDIQVKVLASIIKLFVDEKWRDGICSVSRLVADKNISPEIQKDLAKIKVNEDISNAYISVSGTDKKDGNIILKYAISVISPTLKGSIRPMDKPNIGLRGRLEVVRFKNGAIISGNQIINVANELISGLSMPK